MNMDLTYGYVICHLNISVPFCTCLMCVCVYDVLQKVQDNHGTVYALKLNHEMKLNTH